MSPVRMEPQRFFFLNAAAYICDENLSYGSHVCPPATVNVHFALCFPHDVLMHAHVVHFQKSCIFHYLYSTIPVNFPNPQNNKNTFTFSVFKNALVT